MILVGIPVNDQTSYNAGTARRKGLTIKMVRRMKHTYPRPLDLVSKGLVDVRSLVGRIAFHLKAQRKLFKWRRGVKV